MTAISPSSNHPRLQPELFRPALQYPSYPYAGMLACTAERCPEHVAVVFKDVNLTYRELDALVNSFAQSFARTGNRQGPDGVLIHDQPARICDKLVRYCPRWGCCQPDEPRVQGARSRLPVEQ